MSYKLEAIVLSALVIIIMAFTCHYRSYLGESFTTSIDPNQLYTRLPNDKSTSSNIVDSAAIFSRMYSAGANYDSKFCVTNLKDPCPAVLNSHSQIPADIIESCKLQVDVTPSPNKTTDSTNFTDAEMQDMVLQYAMLTSQRNPQEPWIFNPYARPVINI